MMEAARVDGEKVVNTQLSVSATGQTWEVRAQTVTKPKNDLLVQAVKSSRGRMKTAFEFP